MRRLIDVDMLLKNLEWLEEYDHIIFEAVKEYIDIAQPVKAIPIEWINSYTTGLIFSDDYIDNADSIDDYIYCIKEMVRDWEKENETNVEC